MGQHRRAPAGPRPPQRECGVERPEADQQFVAGSPPAISLTSHSWADEHVVDGEEGGAVQAALRERRQAVEPQHGSFARSASRAGRTEAGTTSPARRTPSQRRRATTGPARAGLRQPAGAKAMAIQCDCGAAASSDGSAGGAAHIAQWVISFSRCGVRRCGRRRPSLAPSAAVSSLMARPIDSTLLKTLRLSMWSGNSTSNAASSASITLTLAWDVRPDW